MTSRYLLLPNSAEFPGASPAALAALTASGHQPVLAFDAAANERAIWSAPAVSGLTAPLRAFLRGTMVSATTGCILVRVYVQSKAPGSACDLNSASYFDTANTFTSFAVPASAGYLFTASGTLTNSASWAVGDEMRFMVERVGTDTASDSATGDWYLYGGDIRDAA